MIIYYENIDKSKDFREKSSYKHCIFCKKEFLPKKEVTNTVRYVGQDTHEMVLNLSGDDRSFCVACVVKMLNVGHTVQCFT